jgi:hypothetical protein
MSAIVIGDPHFKVSNVKETDQMSAAIVKTILERNPDFIVVLGDVLDRHETIHVSPLSRATDFLSKLKDIAPTYVLIGNHDLKNNRQFLSDEHPFVSLKEWNNITIVDTTTKVTIKEKDFTFVPYVPPGRFVEALDKVENWKSSECIFAHQEFKGAKMGAIVSEEGDDWPLDFPKVVSGHIHDYHEPQNNLLYTGTPIQHSFGDRHDKTISYFIFNEERYHERIDLKLPKKQIVKVTCEQVSAFVPRSNCELKIIITGTSSEIKTIMKHPNIDVWKKLGHKIAYKDIPVESEMIRITPLKPLKFSEALYGSISGNDKLELLYKKIFGKIDKN